MSRAWAALLQRWGHAGLPSSRLGNRLIANVAAIGLFAALAIFASLTAMVWTSFGRLEDAELAVQVDRAGAYLDGLRQSLAAHSRDWAVWDEADAYLNDFNSGFEARHVNPDAFANAQAQGMAYVSFRHGGRAFVFGADGALRPRLSRPFLALVDTPQLRARMHTSGDTQFFAVLDDTLYLIGLAQVRASYSATRPSGYVAFLDRVDVAALSHALQTSVAIGTTSTGPAVRLAKAADRVEVVVPVLGPQAQAIGSLRFAVPRTLMAAGVRLRNLMLVATLAQLLALLLVLNRRIHALVLDPVRGLHRQMVRIRSRGTATLLAGPVRNDELGALQSEFNRMTSELVTLRGRIEAQSFQLGRHQSTAGLMHNVRNSLSPVQVILATLERRLAQRAPIEAGRAIAELADPATAPARRARLAQYLTVVHQTFDQGQADAKAEAEAADRHLAAALEAIRESHADPGEIDHRQRCDLAELLDQAATAGRFVKDAAIVVQVDCPPRLSVRGNRVLLAQILENLVINATEAIVAAGGTGTIRIAGEADGTRARITVADDGEGFAAGAGERLFERGFSTRQHKRGGLGLHWCAVTLAPMGGSLALASPGPGQGAVATVELELYGVERQAAA
jgi:signal transduction histidine kinase